MLVGRPSCTGLWIAPQLQVPPCLGGGLTLFKWAGTLTSVDGGMASLPQEVTTSLFPGYIPNSVTTEHSDEGQY